MIVKHSDSIEETKLPDGKGVSRQVLISSQDAPNFAMRRFKIQPGGGMPRHTNQIEHEQYVVSGSAEIAIGDKSYTVRVGDVVFIPAEIPHAYSNTGEEPFVFLCLVPNQPDKITFLEE